MIKCPFSQSDLDWMALDFYQNIQINFDIENKINNRGVDQLTDLLQYLKNNFQDIITGNPLILEQHLATIVPFATQAKFNYQNANTHLSSSQVNKWFKDNILQLFNYDFDHDSFSKKNNGQMAYQHSSLLNLTTCLYCNSQFTFTINNKKSKSRPQFDHFINKAKHPYFALSFYNLIPSCYVCNSNLKGSKPFLYSTHLHPFMDSMNGVFKFETNISSIDFLVNKKDFQIKLVACFGSDPKLTNRVINSINDLALEDRYNCHKEYAGEIIKSTYVYNESKIKELLTQFNINDNNLFNDESEILEFILGNFVTDDKMHKRILSKLVKDIAEEFGISF